MNKMVIHMYLGQTERPNAQRAGSNEKQRHVKPDALDLDLPHLFSSDVELTLLALQINWLLG
jgi:hypothetical protein